MQQTKYQPLCTHLAFISKSTANTVFQTHPSLQCQFCKKQQQCRSSLQSNLCLHCGKLFCDANSSQQCITKHQQANDTHIFSVSFSSLQIYCKLCQNSIQNLLFDYNGPSDADFSKLQRFTIYIKEKTMDVCTHYGINIIKSQQSSSPELVKLVNLGNTCYLNCVLQCLYNNKRISGLYRQMKFANNDKQAIRIGCKRTNYNIQAYYDEVLEKNEEGMWRIVVDRKKNKKNKQNTAIKEHKFKHQLNLINTCSLNKVFQETIKQIDKLKSIQSSYKPIALLDSICQYNHKYNKQQQQDAQQLLLMILDLLSQGEYIGIYRQLLQRYDRIQKILSMQKLTPIQHVVGSYLVNEVLCTQCKYKSITVNLTYHLSVSIQPITTNWSRYCQEGAQVADISYYQRIYYPSNECYKELPVWLINFFSSERLTQHHNYFSCEHCHSLAGIRTYFMLDVASVLIISFKRFSSTHHKNHKHVQFPTQIDLSPILLTQKSSSKAPIYHIQAVIVHQGTSLHSGHYVCFVRQGCNWFRISDESIYRVPWSMVCNQQAYIIFYESQKVQQ